jgi:hypothetical protein
MRYLLTLVGLGILSAAAWTATAAAGGHGHGSGHGPHGHGGHEGRMRHEEGHAQHGGMGLLTAYLLGGLEPGHAAPEILPAGPMVVGPEHMVADHQAGPSVHAVTHVPLRVERGSSAMPQSAAAGGAETDQEGAGTAQANPTVNPWSPRPPGAAGPGRPVSGWPGPGRPGPGRPARPRW